MFVVIALGKIALIISIVFVSRRSPPVEALITVLNCRSGGVNSLKKVGVPAMWVTRCFLISSKTVRRSFLYAYIIVLPLINA